MQKRSVLRWEREFTQKVLSLALPMIAQSVVTALMHIVDNLMIGQMGQLELAAVTQANRISFLFQLAMFGTAGGLGVMAAQYWGSGDLKGIRRSMAMGMRLGLLVASLFALPALFIPEKLLSLLLIDENAIMLGSRYLRIVAFVYYVQSLSFIHSTVMKSTEQTKLPMYAGIAAIVVNTVLNWMLVFDHGFFGGYGVSGAAIATLIGALSEFLILFFVGRKRGLVTKLRLCDMKIGMPGFAKKFILVALPVILNESLWSLGITCYSAVYGRIGDGVSAVAAVSIFQNVEQLAMVAQRGMVGACGVLIGMAVGQNDHAEARLIANRIRVWIAILMEMSGLIMLCFAPKIVGMFNVEPDTAESALALLRLFAGMAWLHGLYTVTIVGILRAGGDVRMAALIDVLPVWLVGVPLTALTGLVLKWPVQYVYLMTYAVNLIQIGLGSLRVHSGKWIRNLVQQ